MCKRHMDMYLATAPPKACSSKRPTTSNRRTPPVARASKKVTPVGRLAEAVHAVKAVRVEGPKLDFIRSDMTAAEKKKVVERNRNAQEQHKKRIVTAMKSYEKDRAQIRQRYTRRRNLLSTPQYAAANNYYGYADPAVQFQPTQPGTGLELMSPEELQEIQQARDQEFLDGLSDMLRPQPLTPGEPLIQMAEGGQAHSNPSDGWVWHRETGLPEGNHPYVTTAPDRRTGTGERLVQSAEAGDVESNPSDGWISDMISGGDRPTTRPMEPWTGIGDAGAEEGAAAAEAAASGAAEAGAATGVAEAAAGAGALETIGEIALALLPFGL